MAVYSSTAISRCKAIWGAGVDGTRPKRRHSIQSTINDEVK